MASYFLTTAIDYANGDPHLGHAFEKIGADCIARWRRLRGDDVWFLVGMDEHGQKVEQAARAAGVSPQEFTDRIAARFEQTWDRLAVSRDQFIRTTSPGHKHGVQELIERIFRTNPDDFYEREYEGLYCVGCEAFKSDADIVDGKCVLHPTRTLELVRESNWFFRLSKYQGFLADLLKRRPDFIRPESRRNEILGLLRQGLEDISASRSRFSWGVPFPRPTAAGETQTTYVWFDALPNYWTATRVAGSRATWPAQLHVIGKDITRFHCVIWPAMLQAAGEALPEHVWAHGFVYLGGERFSKSAGVKLELDEAIDRFGPDAFRYFLLREIPWDGDGNFSWERFEERYVSELADGLGNLASRSLAMIEKYRGGVVPPADEVTPLDQTGLDVARRFAAAMDALDLRGGAEVAWELVARANGYIVETAPWALAKAGRDAELDVVLASLFRTLYRLAGMVWPIMPGK
ncbi:MAG TPA: methionine--tRNA ligase, partial [Gemmatimonadales bacterium]|nr:methionine--tRNA ligase [Gemmatimonadales bacterium]